LKKITSKYQFNNTTGFLVILLTEFIFWSVALTLFFITKTNIEEFRFEHPNFLWTFLLIPFLIIFWILNRNWKNKALVNYSSVKLLPFLHHGISNSKSIIKFIFLRLGIGFIIIAFANPQYGENERTVESKGIDIMIALDVSKSMLADDLIKGYSRLEIAKKGISSLFQNLKGDHIGIVVFAGDAYKQLPITPDYKVANMFLSNIETQMISSQGTDIGNAIDKCVSSFKDERETNKAIIILSDGEDHEENALIAAKKAYKKGIIINTIGMGTTKGVPIPIINKGKKTGVKKDKNDQTVLTKLNEEMLMDIALEGDGIYSRANGMNIGLKSIINRINKIDKSTLETNRYTTYDDKFQIYLFIGIIFLLLELSISDKKSEYWEQFELFKNEK
jgi:Ca-activated chloride channel family protein